MGQRLQSALDRKGWTASRLIKATKLSKGAIYNVLNDTTKPEKIREVTVTRICSALGIQSAWLVHGTGSMNPPVVFGSDPPTSPKTFEAALTAAPRVPPTQTPKGYVRFDLLDGAAGMGAGVENTDYPEVVRQVELAEWEVRRKLGFLPTPGRIALLTGRGPSMRPMVDNGDVVMVDTAIDSFQGDAVYVINVNGETQIKMLQMRPAGLYIVSANPDYPAYPVTEADDVTIGGKVLSVLGIRQV